MKKIILNEQHYNQLMFESQKQKISKEEAKSIGDSLNIDWNKINLNQFHKGINVEFEHGTGHSITNVTHGNKKMTAKIALAHLNELPDYYTRLDKMESKD